MASELGIVVDPFDATTQEVGQEDVEFILSYTELLDSFMRPDLNPSLQPLKNRTPPRSPHPPQTHRSR